MEGERSGLPKPELIHKLEGCTDEVSWCCYIFHGGKMVMQN